MLRTEDKPTLQQLFDYLSKLFVQIDISKLNTKHLIVNMGPYLDPSKERRHQTV